MNAKILCVMLKQASCRLNFEYVLAVKETTVEEEVRPN
jgi:hypothetical protein